MGTKGKIMPIKKVSLKQWKEMGLPINRSYILLTTKGEDHGRKAKFPRGKRTRSINREI